MATIKVNYPFGTSSTATMLGRTATGEIVARLHTPNHLYCDRKLVVLGAGVGGLYVKGWIK